MIKKLQLIGLIWFLFNLTLQAGWIVKEKSIEDGSKYQTTRKYFYQDQKLKLIEKGLVSIFDLNTQTITFMLPDKAFYWKGSATEYNKEFEDVLKESFQRKADSLPDVEREMAKATLAYYLAVMNDSTRTDQPLLDMVLINTGKKAKIAGKEATMYGLYVNKALKEEFWISESVHINSTFDMNKFNILLQLIGNGLAGDLNKEAGQVFSELLKKGYLMKTVEYSNKTRFITEVTGVKEKKLKTKTFLVPGKYKRVSLKELGLNKP